MVNDSGEMRIVEHGALANIESFNVEDLLMNEQVS